jgi:hypothetical protein
VKRTATLVPPLAAAYVCCLYLCFSVTFAQADTATRSKILLSVAPLPAVATPSTGAPTVAWSTGNGSPGVVTVDSGGSTEAFFAWGTEGSSSAPWLSAKRRYVFRLYSIAPRRQLLARLRLSKTASLEVVGTPQSPAMTSSIENRLLQLLPFGFVAGLVSLFLMYVREVRNNA